MLILQLTMSLATHGRYPLHPLLLFPLPHPSISHSSGPSGPLGGASPAAAPRRRTLPRHAPPLDALSWAATVSPERRRLPP